MAHLKSRTQCPPAGFQYRQPETGWHTEAWDFQTVIAAVVNHRRANARLSLNPDPMQVAEDVDVQNAARCLAIPGADDYVIAPPIGEPNYPKFSPLRRLAGAAAGFVAGGSKMKAGVQVLVEWLGEGGEAVPSELAEARAAVCSRCELNQAGDWTRHFTGPISERIRKTLEVRGEMKLATTHDAKLGVCSACACPLKLKVHVPLSFIKAHMSAEVRDALVPACWMKTEGV